MIQFDYDETEILDDALRLLVRSIGRTETDLCEFEMSNAARSEIMRNINEKRNRIIKLVEKIRLNIDHADDPTF